MRKEKKKIRENHEKRKKENPREKGRRERRE